jgi:hypothetical protein
MRVSSVCAALLLAIVAGSGCKDILGQGDCAGVGHPPPVSVTIRNQYGTPVALGAVVTFITGTQQFPDSTLYDSLTVGAGGEGATYDIQVDKPFHATQTIRGVHVPSGGFCDYNYRAAGLPITVAVTLDVLPGAPPLRSLNLLPSDVLLDRGGPRSTFTFAAVVDADPGVSRSVRWSVTGDTASAGLDPVTGLLTYRCLPKSGTLTLLARSAADSTFVATATVRVQGHPALDQPDPPCS